MTSFHSIKDDLVNAGAKWEDSEVVVIMDWLQVEIPMIWKRLMPN